MKRILFLIVIMSAAAAAQQSPHGPIKIACEVCHSTDTWTLRTDASFNHSTTGFPLEGTHQAVACRTCHENLVFTGKSTDCASCHADVHQEELGPNCVRCHTTQSWVVPDMRDKHQETRFPLLGAHRLINCEECHARASTHHFAGTPITCITCHKKEYDATTAPNHVAAGFGLECGTCHRIDSPAWPGGFDHNLTSFPLTGGHRAVMCVACHTNNKFEAISANCYDCHAADFRRPTSPNHVTGNFSQQCQSCHTTIAWQPATFDHNATNFPLTGKHTTVDCQSCHIGGNFQITYTDCYQCHRTNFESVTSPNHVTANFSHTCLTCHTTSTWNPSTFNHASTAFPLTGAHTSIDCQSCHKNGNYQLAYTDCYQCHQTNFEGTTSPGHVAGNFSHNCLTCHNTIAWQPGFNHASTAFPLSGAHTSIECQSCHINGNFQLTYTDCYQCHATTFASTTNPNHVTANMSHDCLTCHTTAAWQPATYDHNQTRLPLTGAHTTIQCAACHINNNYQLVFTDCYQCHQPNFVQATNPNHVTGNFSHDCLTCHSTVAWQPATFDHATTHFPLTGAHTAIQCNACHINGNYQLVYANCYQCHQTNFEQAANPNHVTGIFSHDCTTCHTTVAWQPASFDHATTHFALTGKHTTTACVSCHTNGNYQLVYANCYQCHQTEYAQPTDPNHVLANFDHNCATCHTTTAWNPSTLNHDGLYFRINSGTHRGQWTTCATCHNVPTSYAQFTCFTCHTHDKAVTDGHHTGVSGYSYTSAACYSCHRGV